jgi:hypothetical protein
MTKERLLKALRKEGLANGTREEVKHILKPMGQIRRQKEISPPFASSYKVQRCDFVLQGEDAGYENFKGNGFREKIFS